MKKIIQTKLHIIFIFLFCENIQLACAQSTLIADAGNNIKICSGAPAVIGGNPTASGGEPPYTYTWQPAVFIDNTTISNPTVKPVKATWYYLIVTDLKSNTAIDSVWVDVHAEITANAGKNKDVCSGNDVKIGDETNDPGFSYNWSPATFLDNPKAATPIVIKPQSSITYTLSVGSNGCPEKTSTMTVTVHPPPTLVIYKDTVIKEGENFNLSITGATKYYWYPQDKYIKYWDTDKPIVEPVATTTYTVQGIDLFGCFSYKTVTIRVIPDDVIVIYNTFTPNGDFVNDTWFVGNIEKYPENELTIYNRAGRIVFYSSPYKNDWDGRLQGDELPSATYYYVLNLGFGHTRKHGSVTILR
jgi:large repetitive protein